MRPPSTTRSRLHRPALLVVVALVVCANTFVAVPAFAAGTADTNAADGELSVPGTIDTPTRTITIDGTDYEVSSLASVDHGTSLSVDVSTSADTSFDVYLYNADQQVEQAASGSGSERVTFDTSALDPGTYAITLTIDGNYVDYLPVIVAGYDVSADHPSSVDANDSTVTVDVTTTATAAESDPAGVEVAVWNENTVVREQATHLEGDTYRATVSTGDLTAGETYSVYAIAQGDDQFEGESELLGVSGGGSLGVTTGDDGGSSDGGDDGNGGDGSDTSDETDPSANDENDPDTNQSNETDGTDSPTDDGNESTSTGDGESAESVIEPTAEDDADESAAGDRADSIPIGAVPLLTIGTLLGGLLIRLTRI